MTIKALVALLLCMTSATTWASDSSNLLQKHAQFLKNNLDDDNCLVQAQALDALAALDARSQMKRIKAAIKRSCDLLQNEGLHHIRGHADRETLEEIRKLVVELANKQNIEEGEGIEYLVTESLALEVLLSSDDVAFRNFAVQHIGSVLRTADLPFARWEVFTELAGDHGLKEYRPIIQKQATTDDKRDIAGLALAKLGDMDAAARLRKIVASNAPASGMLWRLSGDAKARDAADISTKELRAVISRHKFDLPIEKDLYLASLGDLGGLLGLLKTLAAGKRIYGDPSGHHDSSILDGAAGYGDERFLEPLDDLFERSPEKLRKVQCSSAIVQIVNRQEP